MSWRWISIAALLAAVVVVYGAFVRRESLGVSIGGTPEQPGYFLKDAIVTQTQADGSVGMRLMTSRIEQAQDDAISMSMVRVDYNQVPGRQWVLSARQGFVPARSRVVQLRGDVSVRSASNPDDYFLRVEALDIDTEKNLAYSTSSPVVMQLGPTNSMTVQSFEADLKDEKIRAKSVQGRLDSK